MKWNAVCVRPTTPFCVSHKWQPETRQLVLSYTWVDLHITSPDIAKFRLAAWRAASEKARELGWIE